MARPLRIEYPGAVYHIMSRGNASVDIFKDSQDREYFLKTIQRIIERFNVRLYAYCLMNNHYHLVVETPDGNLTRCMHYLNFRYSQWFNFRHSRVGHLFQGRYKSIVVEKNSYLLEVIRYVSLNPVRASICPDPENYEWSSYPVTLGKQDVLPLLETDWILSHFGSRKTTARKKFKKFISEGHDVKLWDEIQRQIYLGDEDFVSLLQEELVSDKELDEIPKQQYRSLAPLSLIFEKYNNRDSAIIEAFESGEFTQREIAAHLGLHYSTVSKIISKQHVSS